MKKQLENLLLQEDASILVLMPSLPEARRYFKKAQAVCKGSMVWKPWSLCGFHTETRSSVRVFDMVLASDVEQLSGLAFTNVLFSWDIRRGIEKAAGHIQGRMRSSKFKGMWTFMPITEDKYID